MDETSFGISKCNIYVIILKTNNIENKFVKMLNKLSKHK